MLWASRFLDSSFAVTSLRSVCAPRALCALCARCARCAPRNDGAEIERTCSCASHRRRGAPDARRNQRCEERALAAPCCATSRLRGVCAYGKRVVLTGSTCLQMAQRSTGGSRLRAAFVQRMSRVRVVHRSREGLAYGRRIAYGTCALTGSDVTACDATSAD